MKQQLFYLFNCWWYATLSTILLFAALFHYDRHPLQGDFFFMLQAIAGVIMLSIPGIMLYALLCLGLAMLGIPPLYQLVIRLMAGWLFAWPYLMMAMSMLRLQSLAIAVWSGISIGIIYHWTKNKNGLTLQTSH